jgi:hypothetical protein
MSEERPPAKPPKFEGLFNGNDGEGYKFDGAMHQNWKL